MIQSVLSTSKFRQMPIDRIFVATTSKSGFASWLFSHRKARKMTQQELEVASGVDQGIISKYERGALLPPKKSVVLDLSAGLFGSAFSRDPQTVRVVNEGLRYADFAGIEPDRESKARPAEQLVREKLTTETVDLSPDQFDALLTDIEAYAEMRVRLMTGDKKPL